MVWHRCRCLVVSGCLPGMLMGVLIVTAKGREAQLQPGKISGHGFVLSKGGWVIAADCPAKGMSCLAAE